MQAAPASSQRLAQGNVTPGLQHAVRLGHTDPNRVLSISVSLGLQHRAALDAFIAHASDRHSPAYGHYLRPSQFAGLYGPSADAVQRVSDYLRGSGLTVASVSANRALIDATGPVSAIEAAFGVTISDWHDAQLARDFYGNDAQPSLPSSLAPLVVGVLGLNNHYPLHRIGAQATTPHLNPNPVPGALTPVQAKTAYDVTPLGATQDGTGQDLGLFELDGFNQANIDKYDTTYYGRTLPPIGVHLVDGVSGVPMSNGQIEVELDVEIMHAFAPGASVTVWEGPNSDVGAIDTYNAMVSSNTTLVNSTSWGDCERRVMAANMNSLDIIFAQAAAQGQTFFAASGDYGPYDCNQPPGPTTTNLDVDYPASDPLVTGVGGTRLQVNADYTYQSESAWFNTAPSPPLGSGGGLSTYWLTPTWQAGPGVYKPGISNGMRQVPDVAMDSDPNTGYSIYTTDHSVSPPSTGWWIYGGTSAAAPAWAALGAIYNQYATNPRTRGGRLGFANPSLYALASSTQSTPPFHDITTGTNPEPNYSPTPNWDFSTGWGSPDAGKLIPELLAQNFTLRPWLPREQDAYTFASPPPAPIRRWDSVPRQHALPLGSATSPSASAANRSNTSVLPARAVAQSWASWFMPQVTERLMRLLS